MEYYLIGQDSCNIEDLWQVLYRGTFYRGGTGLGIEANEELIKEKAAIGHNWKHHVWRMQTAPLPNGTGQKETTHMREAILQKILDKKIITIVRGVYGEDCLKLAEALYAGGVEIMEVTFDQSSAEKLILTTDTVKLLCNQLGDKMVFGAGTVTTTEMVQLAEDAGAQFIVSPDTNEAVIRKTVTDGLVSIPGAMTPTEILQAHSFGADFVKLFPASVLGPAYLKAVKAPINHVRMLAVGGINEKNLRSFLDAGAVGAGVGGNLVNKTWIAAGAFEKITANAKALIDQLPG